jgi:type I restriction enzyme R subunit
VAIREFPLLVGEADYLLYLDGKAAGIIEAKPEGYTLHETDPSWTATFEYHDARRKSPA